jgi:hypothetical protein
VGGSQWTRRNPPNYVERSHVLLGQTVDSARVRDVLALAQFLHTKYPKTEITLVGHGSAGVIAAYAALFDPHIAAVDLRHPPSTHQSVDAPQFLNVLRVTDIPTTLGLLAPRRVKIVTEERRYFAPTSALFDTAGVRDHLAITFTP